MGYFWLFVNNRDIGKINMGILQEIIKQACLLPETIMAPRLPLPITTYLYVSLNTVCSARLLTADKFIKKTVPPRHPRNSFLCLPVEDFQGMTRPVYCTV